jgi:hypothetical protein
MLFRMILYLLLNKNLFEKVFHTYLILKQRLLLFKTVFFIPLR